MEAAALDGDIYAYHHQRPHALQAATTATVIPTGYTMISQLEQSWGADVGEFCTRMMSPP